MFYLYLIISLTLAFVCYAVAARLQTQASVHPIKVTELQTGVITVLYSNGTIETI